MNYGRSPTKQKIVLSVGESEGTDGDAVFGKIRKGQKVMRRR